ncbi:MAG: bifunctional phosphoribosyl-AMP cyclohydrolase/phosphoribosyl-ATP diphosphatase HisIE [Microscillaceae bacterium]|nr:bifunctional phosphoribosyl-AMP cyclohydrolase/phosphoribosyl-ATP diphosphatase HisIE [Microscillaceae bacterium]MDW8459680.1 bifunctional phosphoribosyl-AMP cyclohydrolase/phosphoribosyl-ATP diphosphatase HisIE [Cytophagales bacterium]
MQTLSKNIIQQLNFTKSNGLIPAIVQDAHTQKVLMLGFMNQEALNVTLETQKVTFFSRTKNQLWTKGETSGNFLQVVEILVDCDKDTLLIKAIPQGVVCHKEQDTCFGENNLYTNNLTFLSQLIQIIKQRKNKTQENSYTYSLFQKGVNKIAQKVGEEAIEVVIEAKDQNLDLFKNECADLLFHFLVLLEAKNTSLSEIVQILEQRHTQKQ